MEAQEMNARRKKTPTSEPDTAAVLDMKVLIGKIQPFSRWCLFCGTREEEMVGAVRFELTTF